MSCSWQRRRIAGVGLFVGVMLFAAGAALRAHEIGTTRVSVLFQDGGTYQIELATDASSLVDKLEAAGGAATPANASPARLQELLRSFDDRFRQRVSLRFDDVDAHPQIAYSVAPGVDTGAGAVATIRLTGVAPAETHAFTWSYGWTFASYAMTVRRAASDNPATEWLEGGQRSTPVALTSPTPTFDRLRTAWRYLALGFTHIVPNGVDHMLFVLGIYLLSGRARSVFSQVSAFTVAHSITLGLSMYGLVAVSPRVVEPMIALSIAYVAIENIFLSELKSWRVALVFAFGLLHGMGFAGALKDLALSRSEFLTALVTFNVGVEMGQLAVIATAFLLVGWHWSERAWYRSRIVVPVSTAIACTAVYWTIVRITM